MLPTEVGVKVRVPVRPKHRSQTCKLYGFRVKRDVAADPGLAFGTLADVFEGNFDVRRAEGRLLFFTD